MSTSNKDSKDNSWKPSDQKNNNDWQYKDQPKYDPHQNWHHNLHDNNWHDNNWHSHDTGSFGH